MSEIQILGVQLKTPALSREILRCIDGAIEHPILFELYHADLMQVIACFKRPRDGDGGGKLLLSEYFGTNWWPADSPRTDLPTSLNLHGLYERLLLRLIPLPARPQEPLRVLIDRLESTRALERELDKAISALEREKQFNRKVELNATVRKLRTQLDQLGHHKLNTSANKTELRKMAEQPEITLSQVVDSTDLKALNDLLTQVMRQQQQQALLKDANLGQVIEAVVNLAVSAPIEEELFAAAILGRIAAVARGREIEVHSRVNELFTDEPPSIETLADGDAKEYAAKMLAYAQADWLLAYCAREALAIDAASNARKELLRILLSNSEDLAGFIRRLIEASGIVRDIESPDTRIKRVRRIFESITEVVRNYEGNVGLEPGTALANMTETFLRGASSADTDALHASLDAANGVLVRVIELRYSHALHAETYQLLQDGKKLLTQGP